MKKKFYGKGIPGINPSELRGTLIVIEGGDGSGRSTQSKLLRNWLERLGFPTSEIGLRRSALVSTEIAEAKQGNMLCPITFSLFYATDFADQLEHSLIPSLRAGFVVVADRYIYTPMVRDLVRGAESEWLRGVYGLALVPDIIFYLDVSPKILAERTFQKKGVLDYWESGMDVNPSGDMYQCFSSYQARCSKEFSKLSKQYGFIELDGERDPNLIHQDIQQHVLNVLKPFRTVAVDLPQRSSKRVPSV